MKRKDPYVLIQLHFLHQIVQQLRKVSFPKMKTILLVGICVIVGLLMSSCVQGEQSPGVHRGGFLRQVNSKK